MMRLNRSYVNGQNTLNRSSSDRWISTKNAFRSEANVSGSVFGSIKENSMLTSDGKKFEYIYPEVSRNSRKNSDSIVFKTLFEVRTPALKCVITELLSVFKVMVQRIIGLYLKCSGKRTMMRFCELVGISSNSVVSITCDKRNTICPVKCSGVVNKRCEAKIRLIMAERLHPSRRLRRSIWCTRPSDNTRL